MRDAIARGMASLSLALASHVCTVSSVAAHGKPPEVTQIITSAGHDALMATSRGLLFGDPRAHRWSLLCPGAFGARAGASYRIAKLPSGRLYVSNVSGLRLSDDRGCSWRSHPVFGQRDVTHLFQEAARPERLYLTVFDEALGGIHASDDGGDTFRALYRAEPGEFLNSVEAARGHAPRLYATLLTTEEVPRMFVLRSRDGGTTWSRTELREAADILDVTLLAVNPVDADELLLRVRYIDARNGDGLLHSRDGAETLTLLGRFGPVADLTFTEDGTTSFLVASGKVLRASTLDRRYEAVDAIDGMTFGARFDQRLLLSGYRVTDGWLNVMVWSSDVSRPSSLERWMGFDEVTSAVTCPPPSSVNEQCTSDWHDWSVEFLMPPPASAVPP